MKSSIVKIVIILSIFQIPIKLFAAPSVIPIKTTNCQEQEVYTVKKAPGKVSATKRKDFMANVSGVIDFITPKQGAKVKAGEKIFIIEQALAESSKNQAEKAYAESLLNLKRSKELYANKVISSQDLENAKINTNVAKVELEKANTIYENMVMVAPFDAIMGAVSYVEGEYITTRQSAPEVLFAVVGINSPMAANFYLPEEIIKQVDNKTNVTVFYQGQTVKANVVAKSPYISSSNGGFLTKVNLATEANIPDGAFVAAEFIINKHQALVVPEEALLKNQNGDMLFVIEENKAKAVQVTTGTRLNGFVEIISDALTPSSRIAQEGIYKLYDGASVQILDQ